MAKAPAPRKVKTRLVPPLSFEGAARVAEAALAQTLEAVAASSADRKLLALDGEPGGWIPPGFAVYPQGEGSLGQRIAKAWQDAGGPGLQIGMDTPQITADLLDSCLNELQRSAITAALGQAEDGGWWALGLRERWDLDVFTEVPMSTPETGAAQLARLHRAGHVVRILPTLRDVDTAADAEMVAAGSPGSRFAEAWSREMQIR